MSFILDALKRAERERRLERPPDLTSVYEEDSLPRQGSQPWLWLGAAFLIGAIVVGLILWPNDPDPDRIPVPTEPSRARTASKTATAGKAEAPPPTVSPKKRVRKAAGPPQPVQATVEEIPPRRAAKTTTETATRTSRNKRAKRPEGTPNLKPRQHDKAVSAGPAGPVLATDETTPIEPATLVSPAPQDASVKPETTQPSPPPPANAKVKPDRRKSSSIPSLNELPLEVREKLGKLQINVHSYSENPDECLVFINMKRFKVGDSIGENGPVLKEITPKGAIIDYGEGQARLQIWR